MGIGSSRSRGRRAVALAPALVVTAYSLLILSWIFANPPWAAPDELEHYMRAVSIGEGQLIGKPAGRPEVVRLIGTRAASGWTEEQYRAVIDWQEQNMRLIRMPAGRMPGTGRLLPEPVRLGGMPQRDASIAGRH